MRIKRVIKKKAIIEVGFAWIFILIAGVAILGLFVYITNNQAGFFKNLITANLLKDLNAIFVGATVSKDTAAIFSVPETRLTFACDSYGIDGITHPLAGRIIFAPPFLKTNELITWTKPWSLGFRITNFLFITSPYVKYYVLHDSQHANIANKIFDNLPDHLEKEIIPLASTDPDKYIKNQGYDRIHVLVVTNYYNPPISNNIYDPNDFRGYADNEIVFIYLVNAEDITETILRGSILFKDKNQVLKYFLPDSPNPPLMQDTYDVSSVYAAFISGNQDVWQCMMVRAYFKARDVVRIYERRNQLLSLSMTAFPNCVNHYNNLIADEFTLMVNNLGEGAASPELHLLKNNIVQFNYFNNNLERLSCPLLY
ncbi:MAG: hypothetical protein ACMXYG_07160 [Candidatus Woesearchaeota archaeon]